MPTGAHLRGVTVDEDGGFGDALPQPDGCVLVAYVGFKLTGLSDSAFVRRVTADGTVGPRIQVSGAVRATVAGPEPRRARAPAGRRGRACGVVAQRSADDIVTNVFARRLGSGSPCTPLGLPVALSAAASGPLPGLWTPRRRPRRRDPARGRV